MSKKKQGSRLTVQKDDGYPFDTGHWAAWTNEKRLAWMKNLRDKLPIYADKVGATEEDIRRITDDTAAFERWIEVEKSHPQHAFGFTSAEPEEKLRLSREWVERIASDGTAQAIGYTPQDIKKLRDDLDNYEREIVEWRLRQKARETQKKLALLGLAKDSEAASDQLLDIFDKSGRKSFYFPPSTNFGKKGN